MSATEPNAQPPRLGAHADASHARDLFWQNVARDVLTTLSVLGQQQRANQAASTHEGASAPSDVGSAGETQGHPFDGRMAVVTRLGQRIAIAEVHPLFACSIDGSAAQRALSAQVQCSVFQIRTPAGEVYTIPISEIMCFHALTPELMKRITDASSDRQGDDRPFGFAAFRSLEREEQEPPQVR